jgi:pimeloyl-ACP methyl ester carboxylesterase
MKMSSPRTGAGSFHLTEAEDRFRAAQQSLFAETGTQANSLFVTIAEPPMRVHVLEAGSGQPVLMIHGGNSVAAAWEPLLSLLQSHFHLYAPDRPGCGLTEKIDYRRVAFREHAVAFVRSVMDSLGLERADLVGNSMGGYWALVFALAHPDRVNRLALVGEPAGSTQRLTWFHRLTATPGLNRLLYATILKTRREQARKRLGRLVAHPVRASETFLDVTYTGAVLPGAKLAWLSMLERVAPPFRPNELTYALRNELRHLRRPVLLIWGDHDFFSPSWGQELCQHLPEARLEIVSDAGHFPWVDEPEHVAELLRDFLGTAQLASASK